MLSLFAYMLTVNRAHLAVRGHRGLVDPCLHSGSTGAGAGTVFLLWTAGFARKRSNDDSWHSYHHEFFGQWPVRTDTSIDLKLVPHAAWPLGGSVAPVPVTRFTTAAQRILSATAWRYPTLPARSADGAVSGAPGPSMCSPTAGPRQHGRRAGSADSVLVTSLRRPEEPGQLPLLSALRCPSRTRPTED